ncbi:hypothetical protein BJX64DRAFT_261967 [Aspergillus heterothallicus]
MRLSVFVSWWAAPPINPSFSDKTVIAIESMRLSGVNKLHNGLPQSVKTGAEVNCADFRLMNRDLEGDILRRSFPVSCRRITY